MCLRKKRTNFGLELEQLGIYNQYGIPIGEEGDQIQL